jgi:cell division protein ZapA (FtsZ GTPase activity inhibitor)
MTYQIEIPEKKTKDVLAILRALDVKVKELKSNNIPSRETINAMKELKNGQGVKFETVSELFEKIK